MQTLSGEFKYSLSSRPGAAFSNMLCADRYHDMGDGATYQDTRLDVRAVPVPR